jgi:hypothetical protein
MRAGRITVKWISVAAYMHALIRCGFQRGLTKVNENNQLVIKLSALRRQTTMQNTLRFDRLERQGK